MREKPSAVKVVYEQDGPAHSLVAVAASAGDTVEDGWYPLIPIGKFRHYLHGQFEVSPEDAQAYVDHFDAGLPFGDAGIPIDEDGLHRKKAEAYAWIEQLEVRDEAVYGYIAWGDKGKAAIAAGEYRYVSPRFFPRGRPFEPTAGGSVDNLMYSAALINTPFFSGQPGLLPLTASFEFEPYTASLGDFSADDLRNALGAILGKRTKDDDLGWHVEVIFEDFLIAVDPESTHWRIAYSVEGTEVTLGDESKVKQEWVAASLGGDPSGADPIVQTGAHAPPEVTPMNEKRIAEIRELYVAANGDVTDEEWEDLTGEFETEDDWQAFAALIEAAATEAAEKKAAEEKAAAKKAAVAADEITISRADLEALQARAKAGETAEEKAEALSKEVAVVTASLGVMQGDLDREALKASVTASLYDGLVPGPAAVTALVDLQMNPCDETVAAMMTHLDENRGRLALFAPGPAAAVAASDGSGAEQQAFEEKDLPDETKETVRAIAEEKDCSLDAAYIEYLDGIGN